MMQFDASEGSAPSTLPTLVAVMLAIAFWMVAESAHEQLAQVQLQIDASARAAARATDESERRLLQSGLDRRRDERAAMAARLQTADSAQMVRAKLSYGLRQKCEATGASACNVRLADDTVAPRAELASSAPGPLAPLAVAGKSSGQLTLADLGVQKSRAVVSGAFRRDEINDLARRLNADPQAHWRINGITVRGSTFEFDVERHIIPASRDNS